MPKSKNVVIRFVVDGISKATAQIRTFINKITGIGTASKTATGTMDTAFKGTSKILGGFSTMLGGSAYQATALYRVLEAIPGPLKAVVAGFVALGFTMNKAFEHGLKAEASIITMTTLIGRETEAIRLYNKALRFAGRTPFDPAELGAATGRAVQYGIADPFEKAFAGVKKSYSAMDIFSALGSFEDIHGKQIGIGRAMQGIMTGNLKMTKSFRAVIGDAWDATKKVAKQGTKQWGVEILKNIAKIPKVLELAEKKADSIGGIISTIKGYAAEFWVLFTGVSSSRQFTFWKQFQKIFRAIRDSLRVLIDDSAVFIETIGAGLAAPFTAIYEVISAVWSAIGGTVRYIWQLSTGAVSIFIESMMGIIRMIWKVAKGIAKVAWTLTKYFSPFFWLVKLIIPEIEKVITGVSKVVSWLQVVFMFLGKVIDTFFDSIINGIESALKPMVDLFMKAFDYIAAQFKAKMPFGEEIFGKAEVDIAEKKVMMYNEGITDSAEQEKLLKELSGFSSGQSESTIRGRAIEKSPDLLSNTPLKHGTMGSIINNTVTNVNVLTKDINDGAAPAANLSGNPGGR